MRKRRADLTVLEKNCDVYEELKNTEVLSIRWSAYTYVKTEPYIFLKIGVNHIGSRHPMCSKGQSHKIFASDFLRNGFLPSPYLVAEGF